MHVDLAVQVLPVRQTVNDADARLRVEAILGREVVQHVELLVRVQRLQHLEGELLELDHLLRRRVLDETAHREDAERRVARLVELDAAEHLLEERVRRQLLDDVEDADGDALEQALHAERLQLPRARLEQLVEEDLDRRADRVEDAHLAGQELRDHLDVAHLVDHLRAGVPLLVHRRAGVGELTAELERRLLAVEELRHRVRELVPRRLAAGVVVGADRSEHAGQERRALFWQEPFLARHRRRPVEVGLGVPLRALAALVELAQLAHLAAVLPGPVQVQRDVDVNVPA